MEPLILLFLLFVPTFISTGISNDAFASASNKSDAIKTPRVNTSHSKVEPENSESLPLGSSQYGSQLTPFKNKIYSIDFAAIHKHRRNNEDTYRQHQNFNTHHNTAMPDRYENNMQQTFNEGYYTKRPGAYTVSTQSCEHFDDHIKNPYHQDNQKHGRDHNNYDNNGFVPSWFAAGNRWDWKSKLNENKKQNINPNYITIAVAKMPFSQNRQYNNIDPKYPNLNINHRNYNYDKTQVPANIKNYDRNNILENSQEFMNNYGYNNKDDVMNQNMFNHLHEVDLEQQKKHNNHATVTLERPQILNKNRRIIYYEDNLDNFRNRKNNQNMQIQNNIVPCGFNYGYPPCENEINVNHHLHNKQVQLKNEKENYNFNEDVRQEQRPQIPLDKDDVRYSNGVNPFYITMGPQDFSYYGNSQLSTENYDYRKLNSGIEPGYVYTLDMPKDRANIPGAIASVYMTQYPFSKSQYLFNEPSDTNNSNGFTPGNYYQ